MKMHYRNVKRIERFGDELSITIPCGDSRANLTRDTTKDPNKVTCSRCLSWIKKHKPTI